MVAVVDGVVVSTEGLLCLFLFLLKTYTVTKIAIIAMPRMTHNIPIPAWPPSESSSSEAIEISSV